MTRVPRLLTAFVVVMLPVVWSLGFWQLERAGEKQVLEDAFLLQLSAPIKAVGETVKPFERLQLKGLWGEQQFLVDNQIHERQVGYWVIQTFNAENGKRYLVNRGWIQAPASRENLPEIPTPLGTVSILVFAWPQLGLPPMWGEDPWPNLPVVRVQQRDIDRMALRTGSEPIELRLESGSQGVFIAPPQDIQFGKATHFGYAIQWFGLGVVLIVGYYIVFRKSRQKVER